MHKITKHPIFEIEPSKPVIFQFEGKMVTGESGKSIAAALHQAGYSVHSHSIDGRNRSLECGIGKCGACEMLVDGKIKRICITKVDGIKEVHRIPKGYLPNASMNMQEKLKVYKTTVIIIGAGPAGLACREALNKLGIDNMVIDNNSNVGGQFNLQTHQFFFFEKEKKFGGMRGFDIAKRLAGNSQDGILLNTTVWDILEGKRIALKNLVTQEISYVDAQQLVVATGAMPFVPPFENDDVPGVYTAAVFQKMMNTENTLLGKNVLTVGAGNIGYLTSYQAIQAGASIKAIIEGMDHEGGFPVQANRVRRLGVPILTSHILLKAIPNKDYSGIIGAVIAQCNDFKAIPGTERIIEDIDMINVCTGLLSDNQLFIKGRAVFGNNAYVCGDAARIGEGTSAVLRGQQVAFEVAQNLGIRYNYNEYLDISRQYLDSQIHPFRILDKPALPDKERMADRPFVQLDCLYGFACNPCSFSCPQNAITKSSTDNVPKVDYEKCIGCMTCINNCPGLAIFGYDINKNIVFFPVEYDVEPDKEVYLVDNNGQKIGEGIIDKILKKSNKTNVVRVKSTTLQGQDLTQARGFIIKENYPKPLKTQTPHCVEGKTYICHCEDVDIDTILKLIGDRKYISIDELKHTTRLAMGPCRGIRCLQRARQMLRLYGIELVGTPTPRAPMANQVTLGDLYYPNAKEIYLINSNKKIRRENTEILIAGGGMAGSSAFRYFAETGKKTVLINYGRGSTWRCIAGGRPAFSNPDISDIAMHNLDIFKDDQAHCNINLKMTRYINLVHDNATYQALDASRAWSDAYMIERKDFTKLISPYWNTKNTTYSHALISNNCWQATPGRTVEYVRQMGISHGGRLFEDCELLSVHKQGDKFYAIVCTHQKDFIEFCCEHFVNAMGWNSEKFTDMLGIDAQLYPVKHQAFITRRLPGLGIKGESLDMIIDRRHYKGFSAVYGQQFSNTGQIIGCASPDCNASEAFKDLKYNDKKFLEICCEVFSEWIPNLSAVGLHAAWAGYYIEPRYIVDPDVGLLTGLRGHGFMLGQYLAKLYVNKYMGKPVPSYMKDLALSGKGLNEDAFQ